MTSKSVLITGCSRGSIGDALAREFHARGLTVFACVRNPAKAAHLLQGPLGDTGMHILPMDVTAPNSVAAAAATVREVTQGAGLDILINNAGLSLMLPLLDLPLDDVKTILDTNVFGVFVVTQAFLPMLIRKSGVVVNMGSLTEVFVPRFNSVYSASKVALHAISRTLRLEVEPLGVKVVHVKTGAVKSNIISSQDRTLPQGSYYEPLRSLVEGPPQLPMDKWMPAEDFAKQLADNCLKTHPTFQPWIGYSALMTRILSWVAWTGFLDWLQGRSAWRRTLEDSMKKPKTS